MMDVNANTISVKYDNYFYCGATPCKVRADVWAEKSSIHYTNITVVHSFVSNGRSPEAIRL